MTEADVQALLAERLAADEQSERDGWPIPYAIATRLRIPAGSPLTTTGWYRSEIAAVNLPQEAPRQEKLEMLAKHWAQVWDADDRAQEARQEAAQAAIKAKALESQGKAREEAVARCMTARIHNWHDDGPPNADEALDLFGEDALTERQARVIESIDQMPTQRQTSLCLLGTVGAGKSTVAAIWLRKQFDAGLDVRWITGRQFDREVRKAADEDVVTSEFVEVDALVVDDVEQVGCPMSEAGRRVLAEVMDQRRINATPTCITTNLSLRQLSEAFGSRDFSRLLGRAKVEPMTGPDLRLNPPNLQIGAARPTQ